MQCTVFIDVVLFLVVMREVQGIQSFRKFKRTVLDGFELSGSLMANRSLDGMTATECGMWCTRRRCVAYSFYQRGTVGICKLGWNPYATKPRKRSKVYYLIDDSNPSAFDGFSYTGVSSSSFTSLGALRSYCIYNKGNVPLIYPSEVSYRALKAKIPAGIGFIDLQRLGDFSDRMFISGTGEIMDASDPSRNAALHWGTSQPNAISNATGNLVTISLPSGTLDDVSNTAGTTTYAFCSNDTTSYRYLPATGKYYKFVFASELHQVANRSCKDDGGRLAITYGINGQFAVLDHYIDTRYMAFWVGGSNAPAGNNIFTFEDGTIIDSSNKTADSGRQRWASAQPSSLASQNCITSTDGLWSNLGCTNQRYYLCEREYP